MLYNSLVACCHDGTRARDCVRDAWMCFDSALALKMVLETWDMSAVIFAQGDAESARGAGAGNASILRIARLLRLTRMLRVVRLFLVLIVCGHLLVLLRVKQSGQKYLDVLVW